MNVTWNSNGMSMLHQHERDHIETMWAYELPHRTSVGMVDVDDSGTLRVSDRIVGHIDIEGEALLFANPDVKIGDRPRFPLDS